MFTPLNIHTSFYPSLKKELPPFLSQTMSFQSVFSIMLADLDLATLSGSVL